MIKREKYLKKIRDFYHVTSLVKILCGLRRSGKSVILEQIIDEMKESGILDDHIIYINFELMEYENIKTARDLNDYVKSFVKDKEIYYNVINLRKYSLKKVVFFDIIKLE